MKIVAALVACAFSLVASAQDGPPPGAGTTAQRTGPDAQAMLSSIVRVKTRAVEGARSTENLGREREGTGVVIDERGHVLTVGYVVVESEAIEVTTHDNRVLPATLRAYDHASGLGLLSTGSRIEGVTPLPLGSAADLPLKEPVMILPWGGRENATLAYLMARRTFSASWEYLLESALFVAPASMQWAGAALVNRAGELVGIGSLLLRAVSAEQPVPGNLFVPVDVLRPILPALIANGSRGEPARPWLGLGTEEIQGHLIVVNVSPDGPAQRAGIRKGDIVVAVGAQPVRTRAELYRRIWSLGSAGTAIPLRVLQDAELRDIPVQSIAREQHFRTGQTVK